MGPLGRLDFPKAWEASSAESTRLHLSKGKTRAERGDLPKATQLLAVEPGIAPWAVPANLAPPGQCPPRWEREDPAPTRGAPSPRHGCPQPPAAIPNYLQPAWSR